MSVSWQRTDETPRRLSILGATGSIGCSTLDLVERERERYEVEALTAFSNVELLARQARNVDAKFAVIGDEARYGELKSALSGSAVEPAAGAAAVAEAAARPAEWVMAGIVGAAGLEPTLAAVRRGAVVALANKECLVCTGELLLEEVRLSGATLLPVDSEHNAIFQVFDFERADAVEEIILTASGGPFLHHEPAALEEVTPEQAVAHPNWDMGAKISIDSATMMNKGLELIEAYHLFPVSHGQVKVLIHPQSVIHSMVSYVDGAVLAQLGAPDMRTPIAYTLAWPARIPTPAKRLDLAEIGNLTFFAPDEERFPALRLAREALTAGGSAPTVLNAANEVAVHAFLERRIGFQDIVRTVGQVLERMPAQPVESIEGVREVDGQARAMAFALTGAAGARGKASFGA